MRVRVLLGLAATMAAPLDLPAQIQRPIFGCRHALSCRNSPTGLSALNDLGASGLLLGGSVRWGPGFHLGLVTPILKLPAAEPSEAIELRGFHLRDVTLLPPGELAPSLPAATPTPAPDR